MRESDARVSEARTTFLPTADASYLFTPAQQAAALQIPAGIFGQDEQMFRANFIRENVLRFDVTQPIYAGGRLRYGLGSHTNHRRSSAQHQFERARQALTLEVVQAYYGALLQQQGIAVAEEGLRRAENQQRLAQTRFEAGSAARLDVLRAEVEVANAKAVLIRARSAADTALQSLRAVMSLDDPAPLFLTGSLDEETTVPGRRRSRRRTARSAPTSRRSPPQRESAVQIEQIRRRGSQAHRRVHRQPAVPAGRSEPVLERRQPQFSGRPRDEDAALPAPKVAAQKAAATAQEQQAAHAINATLDAARLELTTAVQELASAREIVEVQRKAVELARESLSIAEVSYENGVITSSELNDARVSLLQTEWALAQAKYGVIVAGARTRFAAGL